MQAESPKKVEAKVRGTKLSLRGRVISAKMAKTIAVEVQRLRKDPTYGKYVKVRKKFLAHDEKGEAGLGDLVEIFECKPISRRKRWRLARVLARAPAVIQGAEQ